MSVIIPSLSDQAYIEEIAKLRVENDTLKRDNSVIKDDNLYVKGRLDQAQDDLDGLLTLLRK